MSKKKRIAVNARFLLKNKLQGVGTYSHEVLSRLVKELPEIEFHFLFDRPWDPKFIYSENVIPHVIGPQARHPFLWYFWFEYSLPQWFKKNEMDCLFSPDSYLSLRSEVPTVLVMHDIAFEHYPKHVPKLARKYYQHFFPLYANKAQKILCVSEYTKEDIVLQYDISPEKIQVAGNGVSDQFKSITENRQIEIRNEVSSGFPYFVYVGSINPRKNLIRVIEAFELFKKERRSDHKLLLVGAAGWKTKEFRDALEKSRLKNEIILTGHIDIVRLNEVLATAEALVFPSLFEGFGIPIVEAFAAGTPVITSNVSAIPEVAGDAAILLNPHETSEITNAFHTMCDLNKQNEYRIKGKERSHFFDWDRTVQIVKGEIIELLN